MNIKQVKKVFKNMNKVFKNIGKRKGGNARYRRRMKLLSGKPINQRGKLQTLGVGGTMIRVNGQFTAQSGLRIVYILNLATGSMEFLKQALEFQYCRIEGVKITIMPFNQQTNAVLYFKYTWENYIAQSMDIDSIQIDDNSKTVPLYSVRPYVFHFKPPNTVFTSGNFAYNLKDWLSTSNIINGSVVQGALVYDSSSVLVNIQWEVIISFRGAIVFPVNEKIMTMLDKMKLEDKKEINKQLERKIVKEEEKEEKKES